MTREMIKMTWQEFAGIKDCITALCVGSVEQHGPHLPLSVDLIIPYKICCALSEEHNLIVAPPVCYGYRSQPATGGGQGFPGTTALDGITLIHTVENILSDLYRQGRKKFLLMSGHFENTAYMSEASYLFTKKHQDAKVVMINWWELVKNETLDNLFKGEFPGWEVEHASLTETSLMMHFCPELVHEDRIPKQKGKKHCPRPVIYPEPRGLVPESGILYSAEGASADIGRAMAEEIIETIGDIIVKEF
ncbi:MAG: creatininase [Gracilibacteraceae bacterium]|jgi:creatinine amidohydrolase|nr:creatininase [Gracilibacteraceae bacterium]